MKTRRFDAVIFDLFGTLVYNRPWGDEMNAVVAVNRTVGREVGSRPGAASFSGKSCRVL